MILGLDAIAVFVSIAFILISLYFELIGPAFTFLIAVVSLGFLGILTPDEILAGFANEQIAVILMLLVIGDIIRKALIVEHLFDFIFRRTLSYKAFMGRMILFMSFMSAFLNNTPLVAVMMPYLNSWSEKNNVSLSKLLIPLSYAAILGGCATLIGTSTNLIVNGLVEDQVLFPNLHSLNLFDFAWVGVPMIFIGTLYLMLFSNKLLPDKKTIVEKFRLNKREYIVEAEIRKNSPLIGKSIEEAELRNLKGIYLVEIRRNRYRIKAVSPMTLLYEDDILVFAGETRSVSELLNDKWGLTLPEVGMLKNQRYTEVHEIVISHNSTLINKTVHEANFRGRYDGAIIGLHRNGERITGKIGLAKLKAGDVLILLAGPDLLNRSIETTDFYFISKVKEIQRLEPYKTITLFAGLFTAIALSAFKILPLFMGLIGLLVILLVLKVTNPKDLPKSVDYNLAIIIALALALGTAMIKTGVADFIAHYIIVFVKPLGPLGLLSGLYLVTTLLAAYITNKAAVALVFPIALSVSKDMGADPVAFVLLVSFAAAANFMTPIGYQTNLMVYGPGGYSFRDFFKVGWPLTLIYMVTCVAILYYMYFF